MTGLIAALPITIALATLLCAIPADAQAAQEGSARIPRIVVTGSGTTKASPDVAYVALGVVSSGRRAQEASQANAAAADKIMAALRKAGVAEKDIQTANYSVQPVYRNNDFSKGIDSYQVSNVVRAAVRKLDSVGAVIDAGLDAGANNVQGVSFGLENRDAAEERALTAAVHEARRKADTMAKAAGVRVTRVLEISTAYEPRPIPMMAGGFRGEMAAARVATPVAAGELDVTADVTMTFSIDPLPAER
jgi:uncharacterized protein YggE